MQDSIDSHYPFKTNTQFLYSNYYEYMTQHHHELTYLETYNASQEQKIRFIENLYKLAHISYDLYIEN